MAEDYRRILELKAGHFPKRGEPIDPREDGPLGPLWPDGEPEWLREGLASGEWQTLLQVHHDIQAGERAKQNVLSYEQLKNLAILSTPPREWFEEESKPF